MVVAEKRNLKMHKKLLLDVIQRQAGTLDKAILEGVMNAVEAKPPKVEVTFEVNDGKALLNIKDQGIGISSLKEVREHFETFGTPHQENEHKTWAQFRMGRGQLFAFGRNLWRTSTFEMEVDVKNKGLNWHLKKNLPQIKGCDVTVELYENPIGTWSCPSIDSLKEKVQNQVEFMKTPIFFNGEQINKDPKDLNWDIEDENAYYSFDVGVGLKIYNLGAYVRSIDAYIAGTSGIIVSKKRLDVNFARNDIKSDCPIYTAIQEIIKQNRKKKTRKSHTRLTAWERQALLTDLRDGTQDYGDLGKVKLIRDVHGKWLSVENILKDKRQWTFAPCGSTAADMLMQRGVALCLDNEVIRNLSYTNNEENFFAWLLKIEIQRKRRNNWLTATEKAWLRRATNKSKMYVPFDSKGSSKTSLKDQFSDTHIIVAEKKLTKVERRILRVLEQMNCWKGRSISIGSSDTSNAWTDGRTYIVIERTFLKNLRLNMLRDICKLFTTLTHELAHDDNTDGTHTHGHEFLENYYHITRASQDNPLIYMPTFYHKMQNSRIEEKKQEIIDNN